MEDRRTGSQGTVDGLLPHEAVDGDGDEEHEHDLADEPRIGVHPVARLGQEGLPPFAEYEQEERRQCQEQDDYDYVYDVIPTTLTYTLSPHEALPIEHRRGRYPAAAGLWRGVPLPL